MVTGSPYALHMNIKYVNQLSWYTRRASVSAIYLAAELHQLTSPRTAACGKGSGRDDPVCDVCVEELERDYQEFWGGDLADTNAISFPAFFIGISPICNFMEDGRADPWSSWGLSESFFFTLCIRNND